MSTSPSPDPATLAHRPIAILKLPNAGVPLKYATVLMPDQVADKQGVREEALLGRFKDAAGPVEPANFVQNKGFVRFLQDCLTRHAAQCPALQAEAARVKNGLVYVLDGRRDPKGAVQPEDVFGTVQVADGVIRHYTPNGTYCVLTARGFMTLEGWLHQRLLDDLLALPVGKITLEADPG